MMLCVHSLILMIMMIKIRVVDATSVIQSSSFAIPNMFDSYKRKEQKTSPDFPKNSAIITFANEYHWGLVMRLIVNLEADVLSQFIIVAMDLSCFKYCQKLKYVDCVLGAHGVPAADFLQPSYHGITYFKWHVARDAIKLFDYIFLVDADIVMTKNPWKAILPMIDQYDTWYQQFRNSGQLVFRASKNTTKYIEYVIYMEGVEANRVEAAEIANKKTDPLRLDQDNIADAIKNSSVTVTGLPMTYVGHCSGSNELILDTVTYHACGVAGHVKIRVLDNFQTMYDKALSNHSWNLPINMLKRYLTA